MQGEILKKELYDAGVAVTASAFLKQCDKIPPLVMEEVLNILIHYARTKRPTKGARCMSLTVLPYRELNYGLGLVNLHGKKDDFVKQEVYAAFKGYEGDVLIVHGTADKIVNIKYANQAVEVYRNEGCERNVSY